jgi:fatty acid elongase 3
MSSPATFYEQLPLPTIDRPFGIHLWPIFSKAWEFVVGYPAEEFEFVPFETPMSTLKSTSTFIVIYYAIIFGGREMMRNREPFKLKGLFLIHNFYLTAISAILLALFIEQLVPTVAREGIFFSICHVDGGWTQPLVVLYYLNYLTKYLELLDTVFLFLKKKPLSMDIPANCPPCFPSTDKPSQRSSIAITMVPRPSFATLSSSVLPLSHGFPSRLT